MDSKLNKHCIEADAGASIAQIKSCLQAMVSVLPGSSLTLIYQKQILADHDSLHSVGYSPENIISVVCVKKKVSLPSLSLQPLPSAQNLDAAARDLSPPTSVLATAASSDTSVLASSFPVEKSKIYFSSSYIGW